MAFALVDSGRNAAIRETQPEQQDRNILFKEGAVICEYSPYVCSIAPPFVEQYCYRCVLNPHPKEVKRCSGCQYAHYCSKECQAEDWKDRHRIECKILSHKLVAGGPAAQRETTTLMFSAIAHLVRETEDGVANSAFIRLPVDMKRALAEMVNPGGAFNHLRDLFQLVDPKKLVIRDGPLGLQAFTFVFGAVMHNRSPLTGKIRDRPHQERRSTIPIGSQLHAVPVPIIKSCLVNCQMFTESKDFAAPSVVVRALRDIVKGEAFTITREFRFATTNSRKASFAMEGVICSCKACSDPIFQAKQCALKCSNSKCTHPIPYDERTNKPCPACGTNNSKRFKKAKRLIDEMSKWQDEREGGLQFINGAYISNQKVLPDEKVLRDQIQRGVELLHPTNLLLGKACLDGCEWMKAFKKDDSAEYIPWLKQVIPSIELHLNKYDQKTRQVYLDIVRAHAKRKEFDEAKPYIDTVVKRLTMMFPESSELIQGARLISAELRIADPDSATVAALVDRYDPATKTRHMNMKY